MINETGQIDETDKTVTAADATVEDTDGFLGPLAVGGAVVLAAGVGFAAGAAATVAAGTVGYAAGTAIRVATTDKPAPAK